MESDENFMAYFDDEIIFFRNTVTKTKEKEDKKIRIPDDIITDILLKLPVQHVYKLRRVCRQWHQIISDPYFTDAHLKQAEGCIITRYKTMKSYAQCISWRDDGKIRMRRLDLGFHGYIWSSCNGLLLIQSKKNLQQLCIANPVTKQFEALPPCSSSIDNDERFCTIGFIPSTKEYKVVNMFKIERNKFGCEILTLGSNTWRKVNEISNWKLGRTNSLLHPRVMVDGALHWVIEKDSIVSFDMKDETFCKTTTPEPQFRNVHFLHLIEIGGYLSLMHYSQCAPMISTIEVWILKDFYRKNWIKLRTIHLGENHDDLYYSYPICFRNEEVLIIYDRFNGKIGCMYAYDAKQGKLSDMKVNLKHFREMFFSFQGYAAHVNSLISWKSHYHST